MPSGAFDCPICFEPMAGHIFQCKEGHPICGECLTKTKTRHDNCPSCRGPFPAEDMRNRGMEQLAETMHFDCRWGCGASWRPSELEEHCRNCELRQVKCPVQDCPHRGTLFDLRQHLEVDLHHGQVCHLPWSSRLHMKTSAFSRNLVAMKLKLIRHEDMAVLMRQEFKDNMLTLSFSHFDLPFKYTLKLTGGRDRECIFTGRTKELEANEGGAMVWIPKALGTDFRVNDEFSFTMSFEAV
ncbi:unnamed protein product [Polarella glacialis]|uniref:RING-type domain-containing protein n=1 Tax=Polarella glacialis TaxID=89957 RepID=A0A813L2N5_POLGL|nr:unnamed protein product [Polarella glacialis]